MFFFPGKSDYPKKDLIHRLIIHLETGKLTQKLKNIHSTTDAFSRIKGDKHRNTPLLLALSWNRLIAAKKLILLDHHRIALDLKDCWPTCLNTPLILSAKIGATEIIKQLLTLKIKVNEQDYRGFTALHWACILRDNEAIFLLLNAEADINIKDAFGRQPFYYYELEINEYDLQYRYGQERPGFLKRVYDQNNSYFGTQNKALSALRWFIAHIISNKEIGQDEFINLDNNKISIQHVAESYLKKHRPIFNAEIYNKMIKCFCDYRRKISCIPKLTSALEPAIIEDSYQNGKYDRFQFNPLDLALPDSIKKYGTEIWVELQEIKPRMK